jgi:hypothetical protein
MIFSKAGQYPLTCLGAWPSNQNYLLNYKENPLLRTVEPEYCIALD